MSFREAIPPLVPMMGSIMYIKKLETGPKVEEIIASSKDLYHLSMLRSTRMTLAYFTIGTLTGQTIRIKELNVVQKDESTVAQSHWRTYLGIGRY